METMKKLNLAILSTIAFMALTFPAVAAVPGDVTDDGEVDVSDIQCTVLTSLNVNPPACLSGANAADLNCDENTDVVDIQLIVLMVLAHPQPGIPADKDADGDNIHDDCGPTTDCGNESCEEGEYCYSCPEDCSACPVVNPGQLIVTEFMKNSKYIPDVQGEWVEVRNMSPNPIYLNGWTIKDNGGDSHVITSADPVIVPPNGFLAIGANTDTDYNCGANLAYQWSNFSLDDDADEIIMVNPDGVMIDQVEYNSTTFPNIPGRSCVLNIFKMNAVANDTGTNWCVGTLLLECGDWGNPGMMNPVCPDPYDCGNGQLETGEQCDDSNTNPGDGCDENCQEEGVSICGNGELEIGEDCDDGNTIAFDGCSSFCFIEQPVCGNNNLEDGEECDDGNLTNDDGCNSACQIEPECGNGILEEGEQCDPPNMPDCTNNCLLGINDSV
jgi:cysteine-rich repeat protein